MRYLKGKWYIFCLLVLKVLSLWLAGPGATRGITAKKVWWSGDIHLRVVWRRERQKGPRRIYGSHGHTHYNPLSLSSAHLQVFLPLSNNPIQLLTCPQMDWLVQNLPDLVTYRWRITRGFLWWLRLQTCQAFTTRAETTESRNVTVDCDTPIQACFLNLVHIGASLRA